jgi:charged multivesicular body protein 3
VRQLAKECGGVGKSINRLNTNKAQLNSIEMQVNETFALKKIQMSLKDSTTVMKNVNTLIRLPELSGTMNELSQELMKAGIIEEMVGDMLPGEELEEDGLDESEAEINKIIADALGKDKEKYLGQTEEAFPEAPDQIEEPSTAVSEQDLASMRSKLEALRS